MNALNRDLKKLTTWLEELKGQCVKEDPYCLTFHLMPKVGWLNDPNGHLMQREGLNSGDIIQV